VSPALSEYEFERLAKYWWTCWIGLSWGFRRNAVCYWACTGRISPQEAWEVLGINHEFPLDVVIFYRELITTLTPEAELAQMIVDATPIPERANIRRLYAGRNVFDREEETKRTVADLLNPVFVAGKLPRLKLSDDGPASRVPGFRMVAASSRRTITMRSDDPPPEKSDTPLLFISKDCPELISTIPSLISTDPKNPEDVNRVGTVQDEIWQACMNTFTQYPSAIKAEPLKIRRQRAIDAADSPIHKRLKMIEFDFKNKQLRRTKRI
jgi:hypothetical protein